MTLQPQTGRPETDGGITATELQTAKTTVNALVVAVKNSCLYPADHAVCRHSISHAFEELNGFTGNYGNLKIIVHQHTFLYEEEVIYEGPADAGNLAYMSFRDGILWLEFQPGLEIDEIKRFFQLVNHYKNLQEEAEGDLVTALWEADFSHIDYGAADINPDPDIFLDFPLFQPHGTVENGEYQLEIAAGIGTIGAGESGSQENAVPLRPADNRSTDELKKQFMNQDMPQNNGVSRIDGTENEGPQVSLELVSNDGQKPGKRRKRNSKSLEIAVPLPQVKHDLWHLTPEEEKRLQQMVAEEQQRSRSGNVFEVLLSILNMQTNENDFAEILSFLQDEFKEALFQRQFPAALNLLQALRAMYARKSPDKKWEPPLIVRFFKTVSSPPTLQVLTQIWPDLIAHGAEVQQRTLARICQQLTPVANQTLIPLLAANEQGPLPEMLKKIIQNFARLDLESLTSLLDSPDDAVVLKTVEVIAAVDDQQTTKMLLKLVQHQSFSIRKEAVKILLNREQNILPKLLHCLDDDHETLRLMMLNHLGRERSNLAEHLLLEYFSQHRFDADEAQHLLNCYQALGHCGSGRSIPFLKKMLLEHGWNIFRGLVATHREGAALALHLLHKKEADTVLEQAAKSLNPQLKMACRKARERKR
jgi:hypothetical protein